MNKNATFKDLIKALMDGETKAVSATGTLKIIGNQLIHFRTPIAERYEDKIIVNISRYSLQTGQLQKQIKTIVPEDMQIIVKKVPADYSGSLQDFIEDR